MRKILVSSCLFGAAVRYDGKTKECMDKVFQEWKEEGRFVAICPEMLGGLPVPRPETQLRDGRAVNIENEDVTEPFMAGARAALEIADREEVAFAILKESSPSCGVNTIHDGTFSGTKIEGMGMTAALLKENGYKVFSEKQISEAMEFLEEIEDIDENIQLMSGMFF